MADDERLGRDKKARADISGIFEGIGEDTPPKAAPAAKEWDAPSAPPAAKAAPAARAPSAGPPPSKKSVMDIFDFSSTPDRIPPPAGGAPPPATREASAPMAVPMASPITQKKKVEPAPGSTRKERAPSVEELTALADDAYENYNFPTAAKHIKQAMQLDPTFTPAQELFRKLHSEHPNLFDEDGRWAKAFEDMDNPDVYDEGGHQRVTPDPRYPKGEGVVDRSKPEELTIEKRNVGEKGLVKTSKGFTDKKVYRAPRTITEEASIDDKKGYRDKKGFMSSKGALVGLLMGVVGIGVIVFALYWTGMLEL